MKSLLGKILVNTTTIQYGAVVLGLTLCNQASALNLFTNGSFDSGNTGFGSDLGYVANPPFYPDQNGVYGIATNPALWFTFAPWSNMGDHTTGTGQMLIATPDPGSARIWFESENVIAGTTYAFSGWAADVSGGTMPILSINAENSSLGTFDLTSLGVGTWGPFSFNYTAGSSGPVVFSITDLAASNWGNDFVIDDLNLTVVPEPSFFALLGLGAAVLVRSRRRK